MTLDQFIQLLEKNADQPLDFVVEGKKIHGSYHITEIKNVRIDSVDCGGVRNQWSEVIFQLLAPAKDDPSRRMTAAKARKIYDSAKRLQDFDTRAEIIFEFEPEGSSTRLLKVATATASE